jgi:hypothetical protein
MSCTGRHHPGDPKHSGHRQAGAKRWVGTGLSIELSAAADAQSLRPSREEKVDHNV